MCWPGWNDLTKRMCLNRAGLCKYLNVVFYSPEYCRSQSVPVLNRVSCVRALFTHVCQNATLLCPFIQPRPTAGCARERVYTCHSTALVLMSALTGRSSPSVQSLWTPEKVEIRQRPKLLSSLGTDLQGGMFVFVLRFHNPNQSSNSSVHHFLCKK